MGAAFFFVGRLIVALQGSVCWNLFLFADFVADQRASSSAAHGAQRATKHCITNQATSHSANAGADLCIGRVRAATCERDKRGSGDRN